MTKGYRHARHTDNSDIEGVYVNGVEVEAIEACEKQGYAIVYVYNQEGERIPDPNRRGSARAVIYGYVEIRSRLAAVGGKDSD